MRRSIAVATVGGLGVWAAAASPAWAGASAVGTARSAPAKTAVVRSGAPGPAATKTVVYEGYELRVPASWPVYRLEQAPATCVRYDINAVYLGTPGVNQRCPAHLVGRTQTVSIIPSTVVASGSGAEITDQRAQPGVTGGRQVGSLPAVHAVVTQDSQQDELRVTLGAVAPGLSSGATVVATYGGNPSLTEQMLATLRPVPGTTPAAGHATARSTGAPDYPGTRGAAHQGNSPMPGFDACTAPSLATMGAWHGAYDAIGIYIGGVNMACSYGNLSASWVGAVAAMGWAMLPTYVGLQAPCFGDVAINPSQAAAEGSAAASDAVIDAEQFGLGKGSPIYYDMETFDQSDVSCDSAVLTFLGAWSRQLAALGYVSGVYSGRDSGIASMQAAAIGGVPGFTVPQAIWMAQWDGVPTLSSGTLVWPLSDRVKQYLGPHNQTVGGATLNIDSDYVGGPVAR